MLFNSKPYTFDRVFRLLAGLVVAAALLWLLNYLSDVLIPFVVAFLLAYLLNPLVTRLQKYVRSRGAAVTVTLGLIIILCGGVLLLHAGACLTSCASSGGTTILSIWGSWPRPSPRPWNCLKSRSRRPGPAA